MRIPAWSGAGDCRWLPVDAGLGRGRASRWLSCAGFRVVPRSGGVWLPLVPRWPPPPELLLTCFPNLWPRFHYTAREQLEQVPMVIRDGEPSGQWSENLFSPTTSYLPATTFFFNLL